DSPNEEFDMGVERRDQERPGPPSPEVEDLITEDDAHEDVDWREHHIVGFGADRGLTQNPDVESQEFEEQNLDELNAEQYYDERETGTPAAELKNDEEEV